MTITSFSVKESWRKILNIGVRGDLSPLEIRQIQTINGLCVMGSIVLFVLFFVNIVYVGYLAAMIDVVGIFGVILPTWYLNYRGKYVVARMLVFYACTIISMVMAIYNAINDRPLYTEIVILAMSPAAILFFENNLKNFSFFFAVACYLVVFFIRLSLFSGDTTLYFFNIDLAAFGFSICYGLANIHKNAYIATQQIILDQNRELRARKREIEGQAQKLVELNQLKDKFLGIITHDMRSPLNSFQSAIDMLVSNRVSKEEFNTFLKMISLQAGQTRELLDNLLYWAKDQLNGSPVKPTIVDVNVLIQKAVEFFSQEATDKSIDIECETDHNLKGWGDSENILLVIRNLVANAIKFSEPGDKIIISATTKEEFIKITVEDFGVGIPSDVIGKVFTAHIRSTPGTQNEKGSGFGLMLCREFVERNGGKIEVHSIPNQGSVFSFTIPKYLILYN